MPTGYFETGFDMVGFDTTPFDQITIAQPSVNQTFDESLYSYLGGRLDFPIYPGHVPQTVPLPAFSFLALGESPLYLLNSRATSYSIMTYRFNAWSSNYLQAVQMEQSLRNCLHGFHGYMGTTYVYTSRMETRTSDAEENIDGSDSWIYSVETEYRIQYREQSIPTF